MGYRLTPSWQSIVEHALQVAADRFDDDAKRFHNVAAALQRGEPVPLFADGDQGMRAAVRLEAQFLEYAKAARDLLEEMQGNDEDY